MEVKLFECMGEYKKIIVVVVVGVLASLGVSNLVQRLESDRFEAEFARECASLSMALRREAETNLMQINNLASLFRASEKVKRREFEAYVSDILARHGSIKALEWVPRIVDGDRVAFESELRHGDSVPKRIREHGENGMLRAASARAEYFPVFYVEPRAPNVAAMGFDLASEPSRAFALRRAAETGKQTATRPITLVQSQSAGAGLVVMNPLYDEAAEGTNAETRWNALEGFAVGVFLIAELADDAFARQLPAWMEVTIHDVTTSEAPMVVFSRGAVGPLLEANSSTHRLEFAGREWSLRFVPERAHVLAQRLSPPWAVLATGLVMTSLLGLSLGKTIHQSAKTRSAELRTREALRDREAAFDEAAMFGSITEKINLGHGIGEILDFVYTGFENIIPYDRIGLALVEDDGTMVRSRWTRTRRGGTRHGDGDGFCAPLEGSSLMAVLESGQPRIIDDLPDYSRMHPDATSSHSISDEGMRSSLTCPLVMKGKAVGFLFFASENPKTYQSGHVETFMRVARQLSVIVEKGQLFDALAEEEKRSEQILRSLLPREILQRVKNGERVIADEVPSVSVVFADLVGFSDWSSGLGSAELVTLLNRVFQRFDVLGRKAGLVKIGTQGDGYLAVAGLPTPRPDHARMAADYALELQRACAEFRGPDERPLSLRIGIHSGPVVAGVLGKWAWRYDVWGRTVNLASRMESQSDPGRIQVSSETAALLRGDYHLEERSPIIAKGFGRIQTYWLEGRREESALPAVPIEG